MDDDLQCFDPIYLEEETEDEGEKIEFLEDGNWDNVDENTLGSLKSQAQAEDVGSTKKALVIESCDLSSTVNAFLDCIIIKADHPDCFFIRLEHQDTESMMSEIRAELEEMTNNGESIVACPAVGQYCIAKSEAGYQRAKVLKLQQINGVAYAQMLYVDLGKVEWINYNSVVTLPNAFYGIPSVAIRCMLYGVKPKGKDWSKSAMECFFNFTAENSGKKYLIRPREIVPLNGNLITKVDLFRRNLNEKESVGDCLLQLDDVEIGDREIDFSDRIIEEELENISPPVENKENPQSLNIPFSSSLNTNYHFILPTVSKTIITLRNSDLKPNENDFSSANLFVSYISHSGCAYIRWLNGIHDAVDLNMIESRLEQIYCDVNNQYPVPRNEITCNLSGNQDEVICCVVRIRNDKQVTYNRCLIMSIASLAVEYTLNRKPVLTVEKVMVYLIDHGTSRSVFVDELYLIEKSLYDIPICTYEYSWVDVLSQSESEFSKCCSERALKNYRYLKKRKNYFDHQSDITSDRFVDISAGTTA
ncbi:Tudor domain-containing protein 6 [Trichinella pseudospiralis]|uniref:Tudor domain-containing protein 6 n=1 Tax=Trichinella pseudospiralis TaxID=6337 RepID=A0A0V1JGI2_TRIPS|nr:Tudor domain-containing protein 6 [Trichinella pseudospiralis]KRZ34070.1 Tudor domain-containing protein 6 [Trichinella pseudospiralis]KRZ45058.1 Tudor domain-containing protein 6 [Trichinella pseudospiralis]